MDSLSFSVFDLTIGLREPGHRSRHARRGVSHAPDWAHRHCRGVRRGSQLPRRLAESCDARLRHLRERRSFDVSDRHGARERAIAGRVDHASVRRRSAAVDAADRASVHLSSARAVAHRAWRCIGGGRRDQRARRRFVEQPGAHCSLARDRPPGRAARVPVAQSGIDEAGLSHGKHHLPRIERESRRRDAAAEAMARLAAVGGADRSQSCCSLS